MAAKKIGAIITLDGEKEFKQNVTNCNKSLSSLKSELNLVKAQYDGQENSLEALTKKHEVYSKILEEQKNKQAQVTKGLEHAKQGYEKVTAGLTRLNKEQQDHEEHLQELKAEYENASKRLNEMEKAGNASEKSIKKQIAVVETLTKELNEEQQALKDISIALEREGKEQERATNKIKDWGVKLNNAEVQLIRTTAEVNRNAAYMEEAKKSTDGCATSIDKYGKKVEDAKEITVDFGEIVKANLGNTVVNTVKSVALQSVSSVLDMEKAQRQFQASTGATTVEMGKYKKVMDDLHSNNYGEDINDTAQAMAIVKQYTGELDSSKLKEMTKNGIAMRDVFDMELGETIRGVNALVENMGLTSEEAFDLMAKGAQNGLDKSGELADNIAEYGPLWEQAGFSAKEMFTIMQNGLESGAYNLDKVNDFVKEFGISLADGRIEENLESFSKETQMLFKYWKAGKATTKDVFHSVIKDLATATNKQEALTLASNTWSALGEDNAMDVITSLNKVNHTYDDVKGTMNEINQIKYDTLESRFQSLGKKFQIEVAAPIAEKALPAIETGLDFVIENMEALVSVTGTVAAGAVAFKTVSAATEIYELATKKATVATEGATAAQKVFNLVQNANPIGIVVTALVAAGTALATYAEFAGEASKEVQMLSEKNKKVCESANEVSKAAKELTANYEDNTEEMQAQGQYAKELADDLESLTKQENLSTEQKSIVCQYVSQLNELVPNLNLAYDEQANKLNMTNQQLEEYLNNNQKQIEQQAAQEYAIELLKKKSELEVEAIKLENQQAELGDRKIGILDRINALTMGLQMGNMDYYQTVKELSEAQKENTDAVAENEKQQKNIQAQIEANSEYINQITQKTNENTDATNTNSDAQTAAAEANALAVQSIADTYTGMQQKVSEVIESQMNMFEEFNAGTEISSQKLLENMQSQIEGVSQWADNMALLADRGVNQGIIDKLAEMGPQGSSYVQAFASMTDEQLKQANEMWSQSLDMKAGVDASVQGMIEQYTVALNGGKEKINALMGEYSVDTVKGLVSGISVNQKQVYNETERLGEMAAQGYEDEMEIHSPSKVFKRLGGYTVEGLASGIKSQTGTIKKAMSSIQKTVKAVKLDQNTLYDEGEDVSKGLANGIKAGRSNVINAVSQVCAAAVKEARSKLDIHSPSKVFEKLGGYTAEGFGIGYKNKMNDVNGMIRESMDIPTMTGNERNISKTGNSLEKIVLEMPIYVGESYSRTEIIDIAMQGISKKQSGYLRAKGMRLNYG